MFSHETFACRTLLKKPISSRGSAVTLFLQEILMFGRLLRIDLTAGTIQPAEIPLDYVRGYLGGSGLGARILWDEIDTTLDPLDPGSPLLWITGPLTGSAGPATGRFTICGRSPQTGLWGEANIGGFVGPELRFAGWDAVLVTGRAKKPVYLWIHNDQVELRPADHLWGQTDTYETQVKIRAEVGVLKAKVACIGRAGERGVSFSGIFSDHGRAAARTGLGSLMGSKNLKALAVRGTGRLTFASSEAFKRLRVDSNKELLQQNMTSVLKATGTAGAADYLQMLGDMPQKYWTAPTFAGASSVSGAEMAETILTGTTACQGCVISCGREVEIKEGPYASGGKIKGPEYETICSFGPQLMIDDLAAITALGERCDRLGMDTISAGNTLALAFLLFDRGIISEADTGGLRLQWGDPAPCFTLLDQMANCEGFGSLLAEGSLRLGQAYGVPELAVQVHGLDVAMHDPRAFSGQALSYLTSPRGACHNQSDYFTIELGGSMEDIGIPMTDRFTDLGKAHYVARHQDWRTMQNSLVMCFFAVVPPQTVLELVRAAVGGDWEVDDLLLAGERAWNLKRCLNLRLGLDLENEKLPDLLRQPLPEGGQEGHVIAVDAMLDEYYAARSWDRQTGWPTSQKLEQLGLDFVNDQ
jgi:aldehyde:ferredoxin oxidoreductase